LRANNNNKIKNLISFDNKGNVEDIESINTYIKQEKRHFRKGEFYMQAFIFDDLIMDKNYNNVDLKLLVALKRRIDYNNRIKGFTQKMLAEEIKSSQANVSRSLKKLETDEIIYKDGLDLYFNDKYIKYSGDDKRKKQK